jgi:hypothetical protein
LAIKNSHRETPNDTTGDQKGSKEMTEKTNHCHVIVTIEYRCVSPGTECKFFEPSNELPCANWDAYECFEEQARKEAAKDIEL